AFERRVDVGRGNLLRYHAELRKDHAAEPADPKLEALEVVDRVDLLAVEAAHLHAHIAAGDRQDAVLLHEVAHELQPAAGIHPTLLLAGVEPERQTTIECQCRVLADIERGQRMAALDRTGLRGVPNLQRRYDLAAGEDLDLELLLGELADTLGHGLDSAVESVEALRPARCQPPTNG